MRNEYPIRAADVAYRIIDGEAILVTAREGKIYSLNSVGAKIWELADGTNSVSEVVASICETFKIEKERASIDCMEFIEELSSKGILKLKKGGGNDGEEVSALRETGDH